MTIVTLIKPLQHGRNEVTMGKFESKYKQKDEGQYVMSSIIICRPVCIWYFLNEERKLK